METILHRRVLTRLAAAGIDDGDGSGIRRVNDPRIRNLYWIPTDVLIRAVEHYRELMAAGVLDKWETRDGEKLICAAESDGTDE